MFRDYLLSLEEKEFCLAVKLVVGRSCLRVSRVSINYP